MCWLWGMRPRIKRDECKTYPVFLVFPWCTWENRKWTYQELGTEESPLDMNNHITWLVSNTSHPQLSTCFAKHVSAGKQLIWITLQGHGRFRNIRNKNTLPAAHTDLPPLTREYTSTRHLLCGKKTKMWQDYSLYCTHEMKIKGKQHVLFHLVSVICCCRGVFCAFCFVLVFCFVLFTGIEVLECLGLTVLLSDGVRSLITFPLIFVLPLSPFVPSISTLKTMAFPFLTSVHNIFTFDLA